MGAFFSHENHPFPPSLSDCGKLRLGKKSDLLNILGKITQTDPPDSIDVQLLDGAAVVHFLPIANVVTFDEYADQIFVPHIIQQLRNSKRVDIVWDTYKVGSIKESTREKRGHGVRRKVAGKNKLPGNWADFLRDTTNKRELFTFLSDRIASLECPEGNEDTQCSFGGARHGCRRGRMPVAFLTALVWLLLLPTQSARRCWKSTRRDVSWLQTAAAELQTKIRQDRRRYL